jgi:thiol-disulfide isomerase/thioredoxin
MIKHTLAIVSFIAGTAVAVAHADTKAVPEGTGIGEHVPQFTAQVIDLSADPPKTADFDSHKTTRPSVYIFVGVTCPATNAYADRLKQLGDTYGAKGVDFIFIYPNNNDTAEAKRAFHKERQFPGRLIDDQGARLARLFKAERTSELFVTNKQGIVVYHGAIDDSREPSGVKQRYLATALDELLAGKPITTATSQVFA